MYGVAEGVSNRELFVETLKKVCSVSPSILYTELCRLVVIKAVKAKHIIIREGAEMKHLSITNDITIVKSIELC